MIISSSLNGLSETEISFLVLFQLFQNFPQFLPNDILEGKYHRKKDEKKSQPSNILLFPPVSITDLKLVPTFSGFR